jgi:hypothetical protein
LAYQILAEIFAGREMRLVRHPLAPGGKKRTATEPDLIEDSVAARHFAPQYGAGGSGLSSPGSEKSPLVPTCEFVLRSDSDLGGTIFGRKAREVVRRCGVVAEILAPKKRIGGFLL